jgi:hypothetical protein
MTAGISLTSRKTGAHRAPLQLLDSGLSGEFLVSAAGPTPNQNPLQIVADPKPTTIDDVIDRMNRLDSVLPGSDGLKWFNWLYLLVTRSVKNAPPAAGWKNPQWLTRLDVVFANLYFAAIKSAVSGIGATPKSWQALFEARQNPAVDRIQFALAGINAHINRDLSLALLQTDSELGIVPGPSSPEHDDFEHVNRLLAAVLPEALHTLATGIVGETIQDTGKIGRLLAIWDVRAARNLAWDFANHLRNLRGVTRDFALAAQDQLTGALGRTVLRV